ncbi:hypothetical protein DFJ74DRAFT_295807 [Hyaloraphidium curvatum]|nr:hypothetical protein DFJ74DRAFT_295807 [Hyaloraphidium curvatum]
MTPLPRLAVAAALLVALLPLAAAAPVSTDAEPATKATVLFRRNCGDCPSDLYCEYGFPDAPEDHVACVDYLDPEQERNIRLLYRCYGFEPTAPVFKHPDALSNTAFVFTNNTLRAASGFTTGPAGSPLRFTSADLAFSSAGGANPLVALYSGAGNPTTQVAVLTGGPVTGGSTADLYTYAPESAVDLSASTTYWIVAKRGSDLLGFSWHIALDGNDDPAAGAAVGGSQYTSPSPPGRKSGDGTVWSGSASGTQNYMFISVSAQKAC